MDRLDRLYSVKDVLDAERLQGGEKSKQANCGRNSEQSACRKVQHRLEKAMPKIVIGLRQVVNTF